MSNLEVHGLKAIDQLLAKLPRKIEKNILRSMVRAGAQVVRKEAISGAGVAKADIVVKASRSKSKAGRVVVSVGPTKEKWYLKFKETGTKPHIIKVKKARILSSGETVFGYQVDHPGQAATPFLRPALYENTTKVIEAMRKQGMKRIEKEAAK